jgi:hypothetical protein
MVTEIRGSIGGTVFARNRGGAYARARTVGVNPSTTRQTSVRSLLADLAQYWSNTLTAAQRSAWNLYAANVPLINSLGEARNVSGQNMFVRTNSLVLDTGGTLLAAAPTNFTVGPTVTPTFTVDSAADTFDLTNLGSFTNPAGGTRFLLSVGRPQNAGVNFYKAPFQKAYGDLIIAVTNAPPIEDIPLPYPVAAGQAVFIRSIAITVDGRVGVPVIQRFLVS